MIALLMPALIIIFIIVIIKVAGKPIMEKTTEAISDTGKKVTCDNEIKDYEKKIDKEYANIGDVIYVGDVKIDDDEILKSINKIKGLEEEIEQIKNDNDG